MYQGAWIGDLQHGAGIQVQRHVPPPAACLLFFSRAACLLVCPRDADCIRGWLWSFARACMGFRPHDACAECNASVFHFLQSMICRHIVQVDAHGARYTGSWVEGVMDGPGVWTLADGTRRGAPPCTPLRLPLRLPLRPSCAP